MKETILRFLQGALIGAGSILPGVSGGMLCVLFGLYRPLLDILSHPITALKNHRSLLSALVPGALTGFFGLARLLELAFVMDSSAVSCLFLGLIAGALPSLWAEAGRERRSSADRLTACFAFAGTLALMGGIKNSHCIKIPPTPAGFLFCGAVWALSLLLPGLSTSTLLIFLGLYQPMTAGIAALDPACILPLGTGILLTTLLTARPLNRTLANHHAALHHFLFGVVCASSLMALPMHYDGISHSLTCLVWALSGFVGTVFLENLRK